MSEAIGVVVDGTQPLSAATVETVLSACVEAERAAASGRPGGLVTVRVSGAPEQPWTDAVDVALVSKWERALRRLERLPRATVALATGDCGGTALDALLVCDARVATPGTRLLVTRDATATWPGMAGYRLVQLAGAARIRRAVLFGLPMEAPEARELGILDELVVDPEVWIGAAAGLVCGLAGPELAIRRQLLFDAATTSFEEALGAHLAACDRTLRKSAVQEVR